MKFTTKTYKQAKVLVDLDKETISIPKINMEATLVSWGMTNYKGDNCPTVTTDNGQIIVLCDSQFSVIESAKIAYKDILIPGLSLLQTAANEIAEKAEAQEKMMEDEMNDGVFSPKPLNLDIKELAGQYPRAAAYIQADAYSRAANYLKSQAGYKAKKMIEKGESLNDAIAQLDNWDANITID